MKNQTTSYMKILILLLLQVFVFVFVSCNSNRDLGSKPITDDGITSPLENLDGLDTAATWKGGAMRLEVNPAILKSNFEDQADVKVILYDDRHNPVSGKRITFATTHGVIAPSDTTDENGLAQVKLTSEPIETEAWVVAYYIDNNDSVVRIGRRIAIEGIALSLRATANDVLLNSALEVSVELLDASGNPLSDQTVILSGDYRDTLTTNGSGRTSFTLQSAKQDTLNVVANALGASTTTQFRFWSKIPTGTGTATAAVRNMRLFTSRTQLRADNSDEALVTAILLNEKNNPAKGDTVFFQSNLGIIGTYGIVDSTGRASVTLRSTAVIGTCVIQASALSGSLLDSINVSFTGLSLELSSDVASARINENIKVTTQMRDASNNPIGGDPVVFQVVGGTFANGKNIETTNLDASGNASVTVSTGKAGKVQVTASALNASDSINLTFTQENLILSASRPYVNVGGVDAITISAKYLNAQGTPLAGEVIAFYTNAGTITSTATTNASGIATATFKGPLYSGTATIQALSANGSASMLIGIRGGAAQSLKLTASPDNISVNGGITTLHTLVQDVEGNTVTGETVNFRLLRGPGGGEAIIQPTALTQMGEASTTLKAGSIPSNYRAVLVEASIQNGPKDTIELTISGLPYYVTISRPQDDTVVVKKAGVVDSTVFRYFVGAVVQDVNGNPVADGTVVHFGASVSGMLVHMQYLVEWAGVESANDLKAVLGYRTIDIPFEDMNSNNKMDPGIDLMLDYNDAVASRGDDVNGDGVFDYNPLIHDYWIDFNGNGTCDYIVGEPQFDAVKFPSVYADLDKSGYFTESELIVDHNNNHICDLPASGDFPFSTWETLPQWDGMRFDFKNNDQAIVIAVSATTVNGVAETMLTYPRQIANRLIATVNAEANGVRDPNGERFALPVIIEQ